MRLFTSILLLLLGFATGRYISVGVKEVVPFILVDENVNRSTLPTPISSTILRGFTIDILNELIRETPEGKYDGYNFTLYSGNLEGIQALENSSVDMFAAAMTETAEREAVVDFVTFFRNSGLGIIVHNSIDATSTAGNVIGAIFSLQSLIYAVIFLVIIIGLALLYYGSDKLCPNQRRNLFPDAPIRGVMKAAGYSFMSLNLKEVPRPQTNCTWIIFVLATLLNLFFTALITASLTTVMNQSVPQQTITGYDDLVGIKVATVTNSISHQYMVTNGGGMEMITYDTVNEMINGYIAKTNGDQAMLYDLPILQYLKGNDDRFSDSVLVGEPFDLSNLGIAFPNQDSVIQEDMKGAMLSLIRKGRLISLRERWFKETTFKASQQSNDNLYGSLSVLIIVGSAVLALGIFLFIVVRIRLYRKLKEEEQKYGIGGRTDAAPLYTDWLDIIIKQDSISKRQQELDEKKNELDNEDDKVRDVDDFDAPFETLHQTVKIRHSFLEVIKEVKELKSIVDSLFTIINNRSGKDDEGGRPVITPTKISTPLPSPKIDNGSGVGMGSSRHYHSPKAHYPFYPSAQQVTGATVPQVGPPDNSDPGYTLREEKGGGFNPMGGNSPV